jgi:Recombination endonuclease VII
VPRWFNEYQRAYRARRSHEIREGHLRRTFGISLVEYEEILAAQGGGCAICGEVPEAGRSFHVDHLGDRVRGILCVRCNNALGQLKERVDLLERAADYVDAAGFAPSGVYQLQGEARERARALRAA